MTRPKKKSTALPKAEKRLAGMQSINPKLSFGNGLSNEAFAAQVEAVRVDLNTYNTLLSKVDEAYNNLAASEQALATLSENMLMSVAIKYGKMSNEYEMAGGVRRGERRRTVRKVAVEAVTA